MDPQKPVDPSQVKLEKSPNTGACSTGGGGLTHLVCKVFFVLFVLGNVTALYILHFVNRPSPTTRFTFQNFAATANTSPQDGDAVSLSTASALRNGAGTTAYLDMMQLSGADYYEYLNLAPMGTSNSSYTTNLVGYARMTGTSLESVLTTFTVDATTKTITAANVTSDNIIKGENIRGLVTLSDSVAVAFTMEPFTSVSYSTYITPVALNGATATMMLAQRAKVTDYSSANYIVALPSMSALVVAYYEQYSTTQYLQRVKVAMVDPTSKAVTFSADTPSFGVNNTATSMTQFGKPAAVGSTGSFIIPYYTTSSTAPSGLCVTKSTFSSTAKSVAAFSTPVCNTQFSPANLVDSLMLSDTIMALAFYDKGNNNALTVATVAVSSYDGSLRFRSSFVLTEATGSFEFGKGYSFSTKPSLAKLAGSRLVVSFLNPSMTGKLSIKILQYSTETLAFADVTPVLPLAKSDFTLIADTAATSKGVTLDVLPVSDDGVVTGYLGYRGATVQQRFSVVEDFGNPVGVLRDYASKSKKASVAITGKAKVSVSGGLTVGQVYYAMTTGKVTKALTSSSSATYVYSEDGTCLVTATSKIGLAIEKDQLFVNTAI
ncbi:hypothetical protein Gpo141_00007132 [Globisporangium polare]